MPIDQVYLLLLAPYFIIQKGLRFGNGSSAKKHFNLRFTVWKNKAIHSTKDSLTVFLHYIAYCFGIFVPLHLILKNKRAEHKSILPLIASKLLDTTSLLASLLSSNSTIK